MSIDTNSFALLYHPPEERDLLTYLTGLKYERALEDPDYFIKKTKIVYFYIIHHKCGGCPLENSYEYY